MKGPSVEGAVIEGARAAVHDAGAIAMRHFRGDHRRWEKGPGQIVTDADLEIDEFLKAELARVDPAAGWLSEETEDDPARFDARRVWVVDPVDGTRSFSEGKAEFTISVGLLQDRKPILGFVFNPATDEFFEAWRGGGARCNGEPLRPSARRELDGASIVCSWGENRRRQFARMLPGAAVTTIGSLAYKLVLVASGSHDGYISWRRSFEWDIAAAAVILDEAGATLSDADGRAIFYNKVEPRLEGLLAAPRALHGALVERTSAARECFAAAG